jgi:hypothetical protein
VFSLLIINISASILTEEYFIIEKVISGRRYLFFRASAYVFFNNTKILDFYGWSMSNYVREK